MQVGKSLRLSFTLPRLATDGERLTKPQEVEVLREVRPTNPPSPASEGRWELWQTLVDEDIQKHVRGDTIDLGVPLSGGEPPSARVQLAVRTLTRGFRNHPRTSELSNVASISLLEVPDAIQGLQAVATEPAIQLTWNAPAQSVSGYRLFRSTTGAADSFLMIAEIPGPQHRDSNFEFGRSYSYRVCAIVKDKGSIAASEDSPVIEITPRDTFPPQAPQGLTALHTTDAVELIWNASPEADLRGYDVYRQEEGPASKLTAEPLSTPTFRDTNIVTGKSYVYHVTALDSAGNESGPSGEATAEVR